MRKTWKHVVLFALAVLVLSTGAPAVDETVPRNERRQITSKLRGATQRFKRALKDADRLWKAERNAAQDARGRMTATAVRRDTVEKAKIELAEAVIDCFESFYAGGPDEPVPGFTNGMSDFAAFAGIFANNELGKSHKKRSRTLAQQERASDRNCQSIRSHIRPDYFDEDILPPATLAGSIPAKDVLPGAYITELEADYLGQLAAVVFVHGFDALPAIGYELHMTDRSGLDVVEDVVPGPNGVYSTLWSGVDTSAACVEIRLKGGGTAFDRETIFCPQAKPSGGGDTSCDPPLPGVMGNLFISIDGAPQERHDITFGMSARDSSFLVIQSIVVGGFSFNLDLRENVVATERTYDETEMRVAVTVPPGGPPNLFDSEVFGSSNFSVDIKTHKTRSTDTQVILDFSMTLLDQAANSIDIEGCVNGNIPIQ